MFKRFLVVVLSLYGVSFVSASVSLKKQEFKEYNVEKSLFKGLSPLSTFPVGLQALIDDTAIMESGMPHLKAGISFIFADFKYDDGVIKVCELGGCTSVSPGQKYILVDAVDSIHKCITPCWNMFWQYLSQVDLPVWYVGAEPAYSKKKGRVFSKGEHTSWNQFCEMGGLHARNLKALQEHPLFQMQASRSDDFNPSDLSTYRAIIVCRAFNYKNKTRVDVRKFRDMYPEFLIVDEMSKVYSARKSSSAMLFNDNKISDYKPRWGLYKRCYKPDLAQKILRDIPSDMLVIKPTNSSQSKGVIILHKSMLDEKLKKILPTLEHAASSDIRYWSKTKNKFFLVEEFCQSKTVEFYGKQYDPTMRMFFILRSDKGVMYATVLGGYWKIPPKSLAEEGTLSEKHKTYAFMGKDYTALPISKVDTHNVRALLKSMLPDLYLKMVQQESESDPLAHKGIFV